MKLEITHRTAAFVLFGIVIGVLFMAGIFAGCGEWSIGGV